MLIFGIALFQGDGDAGQGAAAAHRAGEAVDLAVRSAARFPGRWFRYGPGGWRHCRTGWPRSRRSFPSCANSLRQPSRQAHIIVGIAIGHRRHFDQLGAHQAQRVLLFLALGIGDDDDGLEAQRIGHHRQADAGIAGRAFDDGAAGPERAARDGVPDDEQGGAVLDRLAGIEEFRLAQNFAAGLLRRRA